MVMMFMLWRDGLAEDFWVDLYHVWTVGADEGDVAALFSTFTRGEDFVWEQRRGGGCAEEDGVGFADMSFDQALVFAVFGADNAECYFWVCVAEGFPFWGGVEFMHEGLCPCEGAVDDVDVVDFVPAKEKGEADMPCGLFASAEDGDRVNFMTFGENEGRGEGGTEGGQFFGSEKGVGRA